MNADAQAWVLLLMLSYSEGAQNAVEKIQIPPDIIIGANFTISCLANGNFDAMTFYQSPDHNYDRASAVRCHTNGDLSNYMHSQAAGQNFFKRVPHCACSFAVKSPYRMLNFTLTITAPNDNVSGWYNCFFQGPEVHGIVAARPYLRVIPPPIMTWVPETLDVVATSIVPLKCVVTDFPPRTRLELFFKFAQCRGCPSVGEFYTIAPNIKAVNFTASENMNNVTFDCALVGAYPLQSQITVKVRACPTELPVINVKNWYVAGTPGEISCWDHIYYGSYPALTIASADRTKVAVNGTYTRSESRLTSKALIHPSDAWNGVTLFCESRHWKCPPRIAGAPLIVFYIEATSEFNQTVSITPAEAQLDCRKYVASNPPAHFRWFVDENLPLSQRPVLDVHQTADGAGTVSSVTCKATNTPMAKSLYFHISIVRSSDYGSADEPWCGIPCWLGIGGAVAILAIIACVLSMIYRAKGSTDRHVQNAAAEEDERSSAAVEEGAHERSQVRLKLVLKNKSRSRPSASDISATGTSRAITSGNEAPSSSDSVDDSRPQSLRESAMRCYAAPSSRVIPARVIRFGGPSFKSAGRKVMTAQRFAVKR